MSPEALVASLEARRQAELEDEGAEARQAQEHVAEILRAISESNQKLVKFLLSYKPDVSVANFPKMEFPAEISTPDIQEVVKAVQQLETSLKPLPDDDSGVISAINQVVEGQKQLATAMSHINIAPVVEVAAPIVKVEKPDLKPLQKAIEANKPEATDFSELSQLLQSNIAATEAVSKTLMRLKFPVPNVPTDPLIQYAESDIDDTDTTGTLKSVRYYGFTNTSGAWYIKKLDTSGQGVTGRSVRYAFGQSAYPTKWTGRAALTYTIWGS